MKAIVFGLLLISTSVFADDDAAFDILQLPEGASVTLPSPATTLVPVSTSYRLNPTDKAQVFRLSSPATACPVKVQFYDKTSEEVKMATLKAGESLIYRFERFNGIRVSAVAEGACKSTAKLVLDSNRPLEIGM